MKNFVIVSPFSFKTSLEIALEVTFPVMATKGYEEIKNLIMNIPNVSTPLNIEVSEEVLESLYTCISAFKNTKTFLWIRDDFSNALLETYESNF